jgi:hypothetical protein
MLELLAARRLRAVVPVFIGELAFDNNAGGAAAGSRQGPLMGSLFESRAYQYLSTAVHARVNEQARLTLEEMRIQPSALLPCRTIKGVVEEISKHLGIRAHEHFVSTDARKGHVFGDGRQHEWEAGLRRLVQAVRKTLVGMLERQLELDSAQQHRGDEPTSVQLASDAPRPPPALSASLDPVVAAAEDSAVRQAAAEMEQLQVAAEMERLRATAAEAERLQAAAMAEIAQLRMAVEMEQLRSAAEAERLRAAVEVEQLKAQVAEAQAAAAAATASADMVRLRETEAAGVDRQRAEVRLMAAEAAQSQQSGCCCLS